jgi:hypothetical protein
LHEKPKQHEKCALVTKAKLKSSAAKSIQTLNKDIFIKLDKMFWNCHALVVENRPLSDYEWMCHMSCSCIEASVEPSPIIHMNLLSVISFVTFKNSTSAIAAIKDLTDSVFLRIWLKKYKNY